MKSTQKTVTRTYDVYFTGKYCGNHENKNPCPQHYTSHFGTRFLCGLYIDEEGKERPLYDDDYKIVRCKECIAENGCGNET